MRSSVDIIGAGLAGCECALALARRGIPVRLFEMKPLRFSPAHKSPDLAELVCSNSLRSDEPVAAVGLLKEEMRSLGSLVLQAAEETRVPAGKALAVDRDLFSQWITRAIGEEPLVELSRQEVTDLDAPEFLGKSVVVAAGPLASEGLSQSLARNLGDRHMNIYADIAPIVASESVDMEYAFWGSRRPPDEQDYLNCPLDREEYNAFWKALVEGELVPTKDFEQEIHFEGCMPIEALAARGEQTLAFGPFKPVGLEDPRTGKRPYAVVQLRAENRHKTAFNLVGCQTKLTYPEQERIFRLIPALRKAEFLRLGSVHRNTYVNAPQVLTHRLELRIRPGTHLAGQITGVEGYVESAACGLWLGLLLAAGANGLEPARPPVETALGALLGHLESEQTPFTPSNVNFGLMPPLAGRVKNRERKDAYATRAREKFREWLESEKGKLGL